MNRPQNEPNTIARIDGHYYTRLSLLPPHQQRKQVFFFADNNELSGLYRYEVCHGDWYIFTTVEKLDKLPLEEQRTLNREFIFSLRKAIQHRHHREGSALEYDPPACRHTRSAVEKWIRRVYEKYSDLKPS